MSRFLETDDDDPILSVVNLVDIFLVVIAVLLVTVAANPLNPLQNTENMVIVKNPGKENMEILIKDGEKLEHYKSSGEIGEGKGAKAGITYRLEDGSLIYVPES